MKTIILHPHLAAQTAQSCELTYQACGYVITTSSHQRKVQALSMRLTLTPGLAGTSAITGRLIAVHICAGALTLRKRGSSAALPISRIAGARGIAGRRGVAHHTYAHVCNSKDPHTKLSGICEYTVYR
jgi:hypothetical protein